jgi:hypothetical protein
MFNVVECIFCFNFYKMHRLQMLRNNAVLVRITGVCRICLKKISKVTPMALEFRA